MTCIPLRVTLPYVRSFVREVGSTVRLSILISGMILFPLTLTLWLDHKLMAPKPRRQINRMPKVTVKYLRLTAMIFVN